MIKRHFIVKCCLISKQNYDLTLSKDKHVYGPNLNERLYKKTISSLLYNFGDFLTFCLVFLLILIVQSENLYLIIVK